MKKKLISLFVTSCLCLSLIGGFFVSGGNEYHINKKIKSKSTTQKTNKKIFSYTGEKKNGLEVFESESFGVIGEKAHQYFYGKSFYFMLFGVIKNLN